jgi:O-antigen ligase
MTFSSKKEKIFFYDFPIILFTLLPFFLITGPFFSDLAISIISLLFLIYCWKKKNFSFFSKNYFYVFIIFWVYLIINSLINNFNLTSLKISFFYFRYGVFVIAILALLNFDDKFLKNFFYCILSCFLFLIVDGFYQYFFLKSIFGLPGGDKISSFFGDEKILGSYLSRLWPIFFGLSILFYNNKDKLFYLLIIIFILSETLIFLSGERVAFFYINLSAVFVILFSKNLLKLRLVTLASSIALIILISYLNPSAKERMIDKTLNQMNLVNDEKQNNEGVFVFSKQHTHHYITAYKMFLDNKFIGVGVKNFRNFCNNPKYEKSHLSCSNHPHNIYFQILSELGIIGFSFLLFFLLYYAYYVFKHLYLKFKKKVYFNDFEICILSGILIYIWPLAPTGNVFNNWLNILFSLYIPIFIWSRNSK